MRSRGAPGQHRGGLRLHRHDFDGGILLLEVGAHAGDRAAGAHAGNEDVHLPVGVRPDLRTGRRFVGGGVGRIHELTGDEGVRDLLGQFIGFGDGALHALCAFGEHQLGTVGLHQLAALDAHGLGHDNDDPVAPCGGDRGQSDAGVAGGGLDNDGALLEKAFGLSVVDHGFGDAVLDRTGRVKVFQFCKDRGLEALALFNVGELQQRRFPDQLVGGCIDMGHDDFLLMIYKMIVFGLEPSLYQG